MKRWLPIMAAVAALATPSLAAAASTTTTPLSYKGQPINGYLGGTGDFPAVFVGQLTCEGGVSARDSNHGCLILNGDGTGLWENDAGPGVRQPPTPIRWYVLADQAGTVTMASNDQSRKYLVLIEFTQAYHGFKPGDIYPIDANYHTSPMHRVVLHSKYRDLP